MNKTCIAGAFLLASAFGSLAADLPRRAQPAPVFVAPPLWGGPFVGAGAGVNGDLGGAGGGGKNLITTNDLVSYQDLLASDSFIARSGRVSRASVLGGLQVGYNYPVSENMLVGVVGDVYALDRSRSYSFSRDFNWDYTYYQRASYNEGFRHNWLATARVRAGVTVDHVLLYVSGGLAAGDIKARSSSVTSILAYPEPAYSTKLASGSGGVSGVAFGWALSAGAEVKLTPSWSLFGEYLYYRLRTSYTVAGMSTLEYGGTPFSYGRTARGDGHVFRIGLNYAFWGAAAYDPIIVRY